MNLMWLIPESLSPLVEDEIRIFTESRLANLRFSAAESDAGAGWPFGAVLMGSMQASSSALRSLALLLDATETGKVHSLTLSSPPNLSLFRGVGRLESWALQLQRASKWMLIPDS